MNNNESLTTAPNDDISLFVQPEDIDDSLDIGCKSIRVIGKNGIVHIGLDSEQKVATLESYSEISQNDIGFMTDIFATVKKFFINRCGIATCMYTSTMKRNGISFHFLLDYRGYKVENHEFITSIMILIFARLVLKYDEMRTGGKNVDLESFLKKSNDELAELTLSVQRPDRTLF